jgi:hypothetical protein
MQMLKLVLVSLCLGAVSQTVTADPPAPTSAPATQAATATEAAAAPAAAASSTQSEAAKQADEAQAKRLHAQGYRPEVHNGVTVYCRKEAQIGTRFETKNCAPGDQIERAAQEAKDGLQTMQKTTSPPGKGH